MQQENTAAPHPVDDDRSDQQPVHPVDAQHPRPKQAEERARDEHADGGERERRTQVRRKIRAGAQPAVEQDDRQREAAEQVCEAEVVER